MIEQLKFGDKVRITHKFVRRSNCSGYYIYRYCESKMYIAKGVYLGERTLNDGSYDSMEGIYTPKTYYQVGYVSVSSRKNPIYVPLDSIKVIKEFGGTS